MKVGVVLPSYVKEKDQWLKLVGRFYDSLPYIKDLNDLVFLCNWQGIPDDLDIHDMIEKFNHLDVDFNSTWSYRYLMNRNYAPALSMCAIRNDAMLLDTSCDLYLWVDDDMYFKEGSCGDYKSVIHSFEEDDTLGLVMCAGYLGGYNYKDKMRYDPYKVYMVNRGLFLKNLHRCDESPIFPAGLFEYHKGGCEDALAGFEITRAGYQCATKFNCSTQHLSPKSSSNLDRSIPNESPIHNPDSLFSAFSEYLLEEYGFSYELNNVRDICKAKRLIFEERESKSKP